MSSIRRDTAPESITTPEEITAPERGFDQELSEKQRFFLYLSIVLPNIELIHAIWDTYKKGIDEDILSYHTSISPFQPHPNGNDNFFNALFHPIGGFIDAEIFDLYYEPRENYLQSIVMVGHPYFLCQFHRSKQEIEGSPYTHCNYFDRLVNEEQIKLLPLKKVKVLEKAINRLLCSDCGLTMDPVIRYLYTIYSMYNEKKILSATPIAIDRRGKLCRFE